MTQTKSQLIAVSKKERFFDAAPSNAYFLDAADVEGLTGFLRRRKWLDADERVEAAESAGQGNMNCIVRVVTNLRTFILKQSRPWVEKYPEIAAPFDRALVEAEFYRHVAETKAADFMAKFHWVDEESRILSLEDLGTAGDFCNIYAGGPLSLDEEAQLYLFLSSLHRSRHPFANRAMRELNYFHIFVLPFEFDNKIALNAITPGLQELAEAIKRNQALRRRIAELGRIYLSEGRHLLHGDFFPGSWLRGQSCIKVIDPEFGFAGPREFDIGVLSAHLRIAGRLGGQSTLESHYAHAQDLNPQLVCGFAGVEVLRRLLGVAQLPIRFGLRRKRYLLEQAVGQVLG